jgi:biopolymer transport protein ExbD
MAYVSPQREAPRPGRAPMAEINMVPLIDVLLVLVVVLIVAAPLLGRAVRLDLPRADAPPRQVAAERVEIAIDAAGSLHWNGSLLSRAELAARFAAAGRRQPQPELHLRADAAVPYRVVAQTLADAAGAGLVRVGFVTEPEPAP